MTREATCAEYNTFIAALRRLYQGCDDRVAQQVYAALCNVTWVGPRGLEYNTSWRGAGEIAASLQENPKEVHRADYMKYYCSGIGGKAVSEGQVTWEVRRGLKGLGYSHRPMGDASTGKDDSDTRLLETVSEGWHVHPNGRGLVQDTASVDETAYVGPKARVYGRARVEGFVRVVGRAQVFDRALVAGHAHIAGDARVRGDAVVIDRVKVEGFADISGFARCWGMSVFEGFVRVGGHANIGEGKPYTLGFYVGEICPRYQRKNLIKRLWDGLMERRGHG